MECFFLESYRTASFGTSHYEDGAASDAYLSAAIVGSFLLLVMNNISGGRGLALVIIVIWSSLFALLRNGKLDLVDSSIDTFNQATIKQSKSNLVVAKRKRISTADLSWKRGLYDLMLIGAVAIQSSPVVLWCIFIISVGLYLWVKKSAKLESKFLKDGIK